MTDTLIVMGKEPRPGFSKTRLASDIGVERAASFAHAFALDSLDAARDASASVIVAFAPEDARPWFARHAGFAECVAQRGADLGERLSHAFEAAFERGAERVVVIGTDTPQLGASALDAAFDTLRRAEACIGPASDGGYYLLGLTRFEPALFEDIPWSTERVLEATLARLGDAGFRTVELETQTDADDGSSLAELESALVSRPGIAPRTRALLGLD